MTSREDADDPLDRGPSSLSPSSSPSSFRPRLPSLDTGRHPSRESTPTPPDDQHSRRRRVSSVTAPPPPPEDFNPPADFTQDDALRGIQSPPIAPPAQTATSATDEAAETQLSSSNVESLPQPSPVESFLHRPQIRALQRVSQESINPSSSRSSSSNGGASDSSELLAARRDELVSQLLSEDSSDSDNGRRASADLPDRRSATPTAGPELNSPTDIDFMGSNTPTVASVQQMEDALRFGEEAEGSTARRLSGASSSRSSSNSSNNNGNTSDEAGAHAWDSVWPAANASHVNFPPTASTTRFPSAPMSPYVTPSFSPAVVHSTTRRLSSSPPHSPAPRLFSEQSGGGPDRPAILASTNQRVLQAQRPAATSSLHSSSSRSDRSSPRSPTTSPRLVPSASPSPPALSPDAPEPGSPGGGGRSRSWVVSGSSSGHNRPQTSPTLPPTSSKSGRRSRGSERSSSFINQFPELTPPFISSKELALRLPRRLSETAITQRRPDASFTIDSDLAMSAAVLPPLHSPSDGDVSPTTLLAPTSVLRPAGPRRARSAQDALGTQARLVTGALSLTPAPGKDQVATSDDASQPQPQPQPQGSGNLEHPQPHSPPLPLHPPPSITSSSAYAKYESAIADDIDDETDQLEPPPPLAPVAQQQLGDAASLDTSTPGPMDVMGMGIGHPALGPGLVDEGDLLPTLGTTQPIENDVTFDDEGLTTLERIFLLSRSEYSFHRAYAARVLGELLGDVDPCESVEYVLPLISGFSLDEDDSVKEAFAADLHRILWYFFSTCQLVAGEDSGDDYDMAPVENDDVLSRHSSSLPESVVQLESAMRTPGVEMPRDKIESMFAAAAAAAVSEATDGDASATIMAEDYIHAEPDSMEPSSPSTVGPQTEPEPAAGGSGTYTSTSGSGTARSTSHQTDAETALTSLAASDASQDQADGGRPPFLSSDTDKMWHSEDLEVVEPPVVAVDFFRPLLGTLLLSQNPTIADPVRAGIIAIISRLRGHGPLTPGTWGSTYDQPEEERHQTFLSQTGPHMHVLRPFDAASKSLVEQELLHGIVLGMGTLSTEVPESLFDNTVEVVGESPDSEYLIDRARDEELFRQQMVHEATLGRALSLSFIGSVSEMYSPAEVESLGFVDEVIRGMDGDVCTRAEAALAMSYVLKAAPEECVTRLLPVFEVFANDEDDQVRQAACVCLPPLCKRIPEDQARREFAVSTVTTFMASSENVRYSALEQLGEVIYAFESDPLGPPQELIRIFCDDTEVEGSDSDWDQVTSFNFPGVCLTLGSSRWPELSPLLSRMVSRGGDRVFRTISAFLHELAQILTPLQVADSVLPVYRRCLQLEDEVRERIFEHIDVLIASLPPALGWQSFRHLSQAWVEDTLGGWRAREQLALHIPSFLDTFSQHEEVSAVLEMMRSALLDPFAAVRDAATFAIPRTYDIVQRSQCSAEEFYNMLLELSTSRSYRQRLTFVRCLREFMRPPPNKRAFEEFFMPALDRLATDILDVRLGLARAIADLFILGAFYGDRTLPVPTLIQSIVRTLVADSSCDVRDALREVGADRWAGAPADSPSLDGPSPSGTGRGADSSPQLSSQPLQPPGGMGGGAKMQGGRSSQPSSQSQSSSASSGLSASDALEVAAAQMDTPGREGLLSRVVDVLAPAEEKMPSPHNRAQLPSPTIEEREREEGPSGTADPFEASFTRARSESTSKRSSRGADEVIAHANRQSTLPDVDAVLGSPPLTPAWTTAQPATSTCLSTACPAALYPAAGTEGQD